jgi:hypothetical protein
MGLLSYVDVVPPTFFRKFSGILRVFPTPFLSPSLIFLSEGLLFPVKAFHSPSFFHFYLLYPVHLFQSLGEALPAIEEESWIHLANFLANNFACDFGRILNQFASRVIRPVPCPVLLHNF